MKTDKIRIHDWDQWQSYRSDRGQPPWIKLHRCLMRDAKWVSLGSQERGDLVSLWLLAADNDGWIPDDIKLIQRLCYMDTPPNINKFIELGLLDGTVTPERRQHDAPETETETEEEEEKKDSLSVSKKNGRRVYDSDFEDFWKSWEHHKTPAGNKQEAFTEWHRHVDQPIAFMLEKASQYCLQCRKTDTSTKHVCRWLKYHGWDQNYDPPMGSKVDAALTEHFRLLDEKLERENNASQYITDK
jgi:hypothetical protein